MIKIAIIDDDESLIDSISLYLKKKKKIDIIDKFIDSNYGYQNVISNSYDLILLDINMPNMDGLEFLKKLKIEKPNQKVIMITALSTEEKLIYCEQLGVSDYITKPFISLRDVENKILDSL